jgi:hypothetical protein
MIISYRNMIISWSEPLRLADRGIDALVHEGRRRTDCRLLKHARAARIAAMNSRKQTAN